MFHKKLSTSMFKFYKDLKVWTLIPWRKLGLCFELNWVLNQALTLGAQGNWNEEIEEVRTSLDPTDNVKGQKIHLGDNLLNKVGT